MGKAAKRAKAMERSGGFRMELRPAQGQHRGMRTARRFKATFFGPVVEIDGELLWFQAGIIVENRKQATLAYEGWVERTKNYMEEEGLEPWTSTK